MSPADEALLAGLPHWAFGAGLVLARVSAAVMLLPGIGETELPATVRAGLAVALTALLLPGLAPILPVTPPDVLAAAGMVAAETLTGLWLGGLARLLADALPVTGQLIAYMLGIANVLQPDPEIGAQASVLARLFGLAAPLLILISGLYTLPLAALAGSFGLIAPGALLPAGDAAESAVRALGGAFGLSVRLAAPFIAASLVWQMGAALLARLAPRLQVHSAAMPGQILGGLVLLGALAGGILAAWEAAAREGFARLPGLS